MPTIALKQMRLDAVLGPNAGHRHVRDVTTQLGSQFARGPMCGAVSRFVFGGARQHPSFQAICHFVGLTPGVASKQARQAVTGEAFAPPVNVAVAAVQLDANLSPGKAIGL